MEVKEMTRLALASLTEKDLLTIVQRFHKSLEQLYSCIEGTHLQRMDALKLNPVIILYTHRLRNMVLNPDTSYLRAKRILEGILENGDTSRLQALVIGGHCLLE